MPVLYGVTRGDPSAQSVLSSQRRLCQTWTPAGPTEATARGWSRDLRLQIIFRTSRQLAAAARTPRSPRPSDFDFDPCHSLLSADATSLHVQIVLSFTPTGTMIRGRIAQVSSCSPSKPEAVSVQLSLTLFLLPADEARRRCLCLLPAQVTCPAKLEATIKTAILDNYPTTRWTAQSDSISSASTPRTRRLGPATRRYWLGRFVPRETCKRRNSRCRQRQREPTQPIRARTAQAPSRTARSGAEASRSTETRVTACIQTCLQPRGANRHVRELAERGRRQKGRRWK